MDHFTGTPDHRASPLRQQQLIILLILSIHVPCAANRFNGTWSLLPIGQIGPLFHSRMIRTAGRGPGSRANGSFPRGARRLSEKSPARHQPSPGGSASATPPSDCPGNPVPLAAVSFSTMLQAVFEGEPWRRSRLIQVGEMAEACQALCGHARAPGKPSSHDIVTPRAPNCRSILVPLVVEAGPSVFRSIRVHWCLSSLTIGRFCSNDPPARAGARPSG